MSEFYSKNKPQLRFGGVGVGGQLRGSLSSIKKTESLISESTVNFPLQSLKSDQRIIGEFRQKNQKDDHRIIGKFRQKKV